MPATPRLLIAYDGSAAATAAIRAAAHLMPGARATVVHVNDEPAAIEPPTAARVGMPPELLGASRRDGERTAQDRAWEVAERGQAIAAAGGLSATAEMRDHGRPWRAICDAARDHDAGVIVCGTRGRGPIGRALGSTSSSLLHHADRHVLVVPAEAPEAGGPVIVGYDGSDDARAAVMVVGEMLGAHPVVLAHAWYSPLTPSYSEAYALAPAAGNVKDDALERAYRAHAEEIAEDGIDFAAQHGVDARPAVVNHQAGAWRELAALAEAEHAALSVVGSRGRGAIAGLFGSVSAGLVHHAERPVLVVRGDQA